MSLFLERTFPPMSIKITIKITIKMTIKITMWFKKIFPFTFHPKKNEVI